MDDDVVEEQCRSESCIHVRDNLKFLLNRNKQQATELQNYSKIQAEVEILRMKLVSTEATLQDASRKCTDAVNAKEIAEASLKQIETDTEFYRKKISFLQEQADDAEKHKEQANHWRDKYDSICSLTEKLESNNIDIKSKYEATVKTLELVGKKTLSLQNKVTTLTSVKNEASQKMKKLDKYLKSAIQVIDALSTTSNLSKQNKTINDLVNVFRRDDVRLFFNSSPWTNSIPSDASTSTALLGDDVETASDPPVGSHRLSDDDDVDDDDEYEAEVKRLESELTKYVVETPKVDLPAEKRKPDMEKKMLEFKAKRGAPRLLNTKNVGKFPVGVRRPTETDSGGLLNPMKIHSRQIPTSDFETITRATSERKKALLMRKNESETCSDAATTSSGAVLSTSIHGKKGKTVREVQAEMMKKESVKEKVARMRAEMQNSTSTAGNSISSTPKPDITIPDNSANPDDVVPQISSRIRHQSFMISEKDSDSEDEVSNKTASKATNNRIRCTSATPLLRRRAESKVSDDLNDEPIVLRRSSRLNNSKPSSPVKNKIHIQNDTKTPQQPAKTSSRGRERRRTLSTVNHELNLTSRNLRSMSQLGSSGVESIKFGRSRSQSRSSSALVANDQCAVLSGPQSLVSSTATPPNRNVFKESVEKGDEEEEEGDDLQLFSGKKSTEQNTSLQFTKKDSEKIGDVLKRRLRESKAPKPNITTGPTLRNKIQERMRAPVKASKPKVMESAVEAVTPSNDAKIQEDQPPVQQPQPLNDVDSESSPVLEILGSVETPHGNNSAGDVSEIVQTVTEARNDIAEHVIVAQDSPQEVTTINAESHDVSVNEEVKEDAKKLEMQQCPENAKNPEVTKDYAGDVSKTPRNVITHESLLIRPPTPKSPKQMIASQYGLDISDSEDEDEHEEEEAKNEDASKDTNYTLASMDTRDVKEKEKVPVDKSESCGLTSSEESIKEISDVVETNSTRSFSPVMLETPFQSPFIPPPIPETFESFKGSANCDPNLSKSSLKDSLTERSEDSEPPQPSLRIVATPENGSSESLKSLTSPTKEEDLVIDIGAAQSAKPPLSELPKAVAKTSESSTKQAPFTQGDDFLNDILAGAKTSRPIQPAVQNKPSSLTKRLVPLKNSNASPVKKQIAQNKSSKDHKPEILLSAEPQPVQKPRALKRPAPTSSRDTPAKRIQLTDAKPLKRDKNRPLEKSHKLSAPSTSLSEPTTSAGPALSVTTPATSSESTKPRGVIVIEAPCRPRGKSIKQQQKPVGVKEMVAKNTAKGNKRVDKIKAHLRQALDLKVPVTELKRTMEEKGIIITDSIPLAPSDAVDVMMEFLRETSAADMWAVLTRQRIDGNLMPLMNTEEQMFLQVSVSLNEHDQTLLELFIGRILCEFSLRDSLDSKQCGRLTRLFCHSVHFFQSPENVEKDHDETSTLYDTKCTWMRRLFMILLYKHPTHIMKLLAYCLISDAGEYCRFLVNELENEPASSEWHVAFRILLHKEPEEAAVVNWLLNSKFESPYIPPATSTEIKEACHVAHDKFVDETIGAQTSIFLAKTAAAEVLEVAFHFLKGQMTKIESQILEPKNKEKELKHRTVFSVPTISTKMTSQEAEVIKKEIAWQKIVLRVMIDNPSSTHWTAIMQALKTISVQVVSFGEVIQSSDAQQFVEASAIEPLRQALQLFQDLISEFTNFPLNP